MPKRTDIKSILILGAGPIIIGQACEFDYSGTQACRALRQEGYRIILINSNPATIMTDPDMADATYIEPIRWQTVANIIAMEKPDAILPTMGGQTALNCALDLAKHGILEKYNIELIGANQKSIDKAEDREKFAKAMRSINLDVPRSAIAHSLEEALQVQASIGYPTIIRPSFTMGGTGGGIAYNNEEFIEICKYGLESSPTHELLIEESLIGWKEFEMEVVRDKNDNCIIVCAIENLDPMGIHTGDSITVAPALTLTDKEYQIMRNAALAVLREIGVETGGSNVQFAVNPVNGRMIVIEMNPRVSRSSALASKATGFPIAKIAAKLAVGYTLDELSNDITGGVTPASFEPTIDYIAVKIPRFNFEKFPNTDKILTTQMKSVGEVMAIGRTFAEAFQKAIYGLETGLYGLKGFYPDLMGLKNPESLNKIELITHIQRELQKTGPERLRYIADGFRLGLSVEVINKLTLIDPWFLTEIQNLINLELEFCSLFNNTNQINPDYLFKLKQHGFSDRYLADLLNIQEETIRNLRHKFNIRPVYKHVDTCAAEFPSKTAYLYSSYESGFDSGSDSDSDIGISNESIVSKNKKIVILGGGPNRIGQGIEFDYCCVHAALAMKKAGYETIMVNCNPETVSTDYDLTDKLYFESLTLEHVLEIINLEQPEGVILHYGGQTPLKLAKHLEALGVKIIGTSPDAIDLAEDRSRFSSLVNKLGLQQPQNSSAINYNDGIKQAEELGYPLMVRPSYVLGGQAMEVIYNKEELKAYLNNAVTVSDKSPVLLDRFIDDAIEIDVDAVSDGKQIIICGIMEHIEQAGVHSGDSACSLPPYDLSIDLQNSIKKQMRALIQELGVIGLVNAQFAVCNNEIYILEVNPRASRTIPFVAKATGIAWAEVAALCMVGISLKQQNILEDCTPNYFSVKLPVFPFNKFPGSDPILGPEMKSTGEVMGIGTSFAMSFAKAQLAAGVIIKKRRFALLSVKDQDKIKIISLAKDLINLGFQLHATIGTASILNKNNIACESVNKVAEGRPHIVDLLKNGEIDFIVNTTSGKQAIADSYIIRRTALQHKVTYTTTVAGALAIVRALQHTDHEQCYKLQNLHANLGVV